MTGITIRGDYNDFSELVDSIYRIVGLDDNPKDMYYGVKNRLLGICYEIRHAYQGDRGITLVENSMNEDIMKWHKLITAKTNVYFSVEVLFPEAIFVAASVPQIYIFSEQYYGSRAKTNEMEISSVPYAELLKDKANLDVLCAGIWRALGEVVGNEELEKIIHSYHLADESYMHYATEYIDKCNIELIKTSNEKRKDKLRNIAKRIVKKPKAYYSLENELNYWAKEYNTNIYELHNPNLEYPEEIDW